MRCGVCVCIPLQYCANSQYESRGGTGAVQVWGSLPKIVLRSTPELRYGFMETMINVQLYAVTP